VAYAALKALVALGEPYSLAVSPELLAKARAVCSRPVLPPPGRWRRSMESLDAMCGWLVLLGLGGLLGSSGLLLSGYILSGWISHPFNSTLLILHAVPMLMGCLLMGIGGGMVWVSLLQGRRERPRG